MTEQIVYYDDVPREAENIRDALKHAARDLEVRVLVPPQDLGKVQGEVSDVDLFMVDIDLTRPPASASAPGYHGTTLVSHLKSLFDDRPVVVITKQTVLDELTPERRRQLRERLACDDLMVKQDVLERTGEEAARLCSLADGYRALREARGRTWGDILILLGVDQRALEADRLLEAAPPLESPGATVSAIATWIRKVIMGYPGILYDDVHAATNLGLSVESFRSQALQELLREAKYAGVFTADELCRLWWKDRLRCIGISVVQDGGYRGGIVPAFAEAMREKHGDTIAQSRCNWDDSTGADQVCCLLHEPVQVEHSLAYYADNRPSVMDQARVSFRAIRQSPDFQKELLDPIGRELLPRILALDDPAVSRVSMT